MHSHCLDTNALSCVIYALRWNNCQANNFDWLQPSKMNYPKYFKPQLFILLQNAFHSNSTERIVYSCIDASTCTNCTLSLSRSQKITTTFFPTNFIRKICGLNTLLGFFYAINQLQQNYEIFLLVWLFHTLGIAQPFSERQSTFIFISICKNVGKRQNITKPPFELFFIGFVKHTAAHTHYVCLESSFASQMTINSFRSKY